MPAAQLATHAGIHAGQRVLDVACGTGVLAITAARLGAKVSALDLTPELLERARYNSQVADVEIDFHEGDVEVLPFKDATFDVVASQFGHIFAPRPLIAISEMLRVLKPGGTIAISTWPPDLFVGRATALRDRYLPAPVGVPSPMDWGERSIVEQRLGTAVRDISFGSGAMLVPALSPQHYRVMHERTGGPTIRLVEALSASDPAKLGVFRAEFEALSHRILPGQRPAPGLPHDPRDQKLALRASVIQGQSHEAFTV